MGLPVTGRSRTSLDTTNPPRSSRRPASVSDVVAQAHAHVASGIKPPPVKDQDQPLCQSLTAAHTER